MFDTELLAAAARWRDDGIRLAEAFRIERPGGVAGEVLTEVLAAVQQGELVTCLAVERTDRTGEFAADGAVSAAAYVRGLSERDRLVGVAAGTARPGAGRSAAGDPGGVGTRRPRVGCMRRRFCGRPKPLTTSSSSRFWTGSSPPRPRAAHRRS